MGFALAAGALGEILATEEISLGPPHRVPLQYTSRLRTPSYRQVCTVDVRIAFHTRDVVPRPAAVVVQAERRGRCATSCAAVLDLVLTGDRSGDAAKVPVAYLDKVLASRGAEARRCLTQGVGHRVANEPNLLFTGNVFCVLFVATAVVADNACQTPGARHQMYIAVCRRLRLIWRCYTGRHVTQ